MEYTKDLGFRKNSIIYYTSDGFAYNVKRRNNNKIYLRCSRRSATRCQSSAAIKVLDGVEVGLLEINQPHKMS